MLNFRGCKRKGARILDFRTSCEPPSPPLSRKSQIFFKEPTRFFTEGQNVGVQTVLGAVGMASHCRPRVPREFFVSQDAISVYS